MKVDDYKSKWKTTDLLVGPLDSGNNNLKRASNRLIVRKDES